MATNYRQEGNILPVVLTTAVVSGGVVVVGNRVGVAINAGSIGDTISVQFTGVWEVTKLAGTAWAQGDSVYYDVSASKFTRVSTGNVYAGEASEAATSAAVLGNVRLAEASIMLTGTATLAAGTVTVPLTGVSATSVINVTGRDINGSSALGVLIAAPGTDEFTVTSVQQNTPASTQTNDTSIVNYIVVL